MRRETQTNSFVEDSINEISRAFEEDAISQESSIRIVRKSQTLEPISTAGYKHEKTMNTAAVSFVEP